MPSYPVRPTFPIDVRSPSGSVTVGRQGTAVTLDIGSDQIVNALPPTKGQFFGALESTFPGSLATIRDAVPSDPAHPANRAYSATAFVVPGSALLQFVQSTLGLSGEQIANLLAAAALQPK